LVVFINQRTRNILAHETIKDHAHGLMRVDSKVIVL